MKEIQIGFLSKFSPDDKKASSGTNYMMAENLKSVGKIKWIPIRTRKIVNYIRGLIRLLSKAFGKNIDIAYTRIGARLLYSINDKDLANVDIICAFFCMQSIYRLQTKTPIIYFSDATFASIIDYYPKMSNLPIFVKRQGCDMERRACLKSAINIFSSDWAASSALLDLKIPSDKVKVIEFGANINESDILADKYHIEETLKILFLGVDWDRKGGDIAVQTVEWLNNNGVKSILNIIGSKVPDKFKTREYIKDYGFLDKNKSEDYNILSRVLSESNCLLLPTKAECAAIAFAEASANGLPIFTHNTGGISNLVINGRNGYMLPIGSTAADFGMKIKQSLESNELIYMSNEGRRIYREKLNWRVWGDRVSDIIVSMVD